jgi:uncharacterized membrane protein
MNWRDLARMAVMTTLFGVNLGLCEMASGVPDLDIAETLQLAAAATLWACVYIAIGSVICRRPLLKAVPDTMTLANIWAYVYGLGLIVFTTALGALGTNLIVTSNFLWCLGGVAMDDLLVRTGDPLPRHATLFAAIGLALVGSTLTLFANEDAVTTGRGLPEGDWSALAGGIFLPLLTPLLYGGIRGPRHYSVTTILELISFAMPFAAILSGIILITLHSPAPAPAAPPAPPFYEVARNYTLMGEVGGQAAARVVARLQEIRRSSYLIPLLPLTMLPTIYFAVQTALLYSTADFIVCMALAFAAHTLCHNAGRHGAATALCVALGGMLARAFACWQDANSEAGRAFRSEVEEAPTPSLLAAAAAITTEPGDADSDDVTRPMLARHANKKGPQRPADAVDDEECAV